MDAIDRDPMTAQLDGQRLCHVHQARITGAAAEIAGVAGVAAADVDDAAQPAVFMKGMIARELREGRPLDRSMMIDTASSGPTPWRSNSAVTSATIVSMTLDGGMGL